MLSCQYSSLIGEHGSKFAEFKMIVEKRSAVKAENEKLRVSDEIISSLDKDSQKQLADNAWLKREVTS